MAIKKRSFQEGIRIKPTTNGLEGLEGEIKVDDATKIIQAYLDGASREFITNNQTQTIENKTIDVDNNTVTNIETDNLKAGVLVTDISLASSDTELPSALAVKTALEGQNEASEITYDPTLNPETTATNVQDALDDTGIASQAAQDAADAAQTTADNHIAAGTGAHAATAISYDNSTSGLTAVNTQAAIDEVEGRVDTIEGSYVQSFNTRTGAVVPAASDYDADQVDFDNATSGLAATEVQGALDEIDGNLDSHIAASSGVHGVTGDVVGTTDVQDVSNKAIIDPSRLDVYKDTFANLQTYALTATNGQLVFATDTKQMFQVVDNNLVSVGSGVSDKSVYAQFDAENNDVTGFTNISLTTTDPINETTSYSVDSYPASFPVVDLNDRNKGRENGLNIQYTLTSGIAKLIIKDNSSNTIGEIELEASSEVKSVLLPYFVEDNYTSVQLEIEDVSSATGLKLDDAVFTDSPFRFESLSDFGSFRADVFAGYGGSTFIPYFSNVRVNDLSEFGTVTNDSTDGFSFTANKRCKVDVSYSFSADAGGNDWMGLSLNSTQLTTNIININDENKVGIQHIDAGTTSSTTSCSIEMKVGDVLRPHNGAQTTPASANRVTFNMTATQLVDGVVISDNTLDTNWEDIGPLTITGTGSNPSKGSTANDSLRIRKEGENLYARIELVQTTAGGAGSGSYLIEVPEEIDLTKVNASTTLNAWNKSATHLGFVTVTDNNFMFIGEVFPYDSTHVIITGSVETGSGGGAGGAGRDDWSSTNKGLGNTTLVVKGEFSYPVVGRSTAPRLVALPQSQQNEFAATIQNNGSVSIISKNADFIQSVSRISQGRVSVTFVPDFFSETPSAVATLIDNGSDKGAQIRTISTTGMEVQCQINSSGVSADDDFGIVVTRQGVDYKAPGVYVGNVAREQVAYVKDVKSNGTNGGTFTAGSWQTRTLNTNEGDNFLSVSSNQITLPAGLYDIEATAPVLRCGLHKLRFQNITDATTEIIGTNNISPNDASFGDGNIANLMGRVTLTESKTFELQHRCSGTRATDGFGAASSFGIDEVYAQVKIRKLS